MLAVIYRRTRGQNPGALPLAGLPLILRQLYWLRESGCQRVAIDPGADEAGERVRQFVASHPALARTAVLVRAGERSEPRAIAAAAGFPAGAAILALSDSVIGHAHLEDLCRKGGDRGVLVGRLAPPSAGGAFPPAEVHLHAAAPGPILEEDLPGWGTLVETADTALRLTTKVLLGGLPRLETRSAPPLLVPGSERSPGVWVSRGARIQPGAVLVAPVLIGPDALVCSGARVGPDAVIGARSIIESGTVVEHAIVESDTLVGEGLTLRRLLATPEGIAPLEGAEAVIPLDDPLLITRRRRFTLRVMTRLLKLPR